MTGDHRILGARPPSTGGDGALAASGQWRSGRLFDCHGQKGVTTGRHDERYRLCEDWDLWIRLARSGLPAFVPHPLVGYRVHSGNSSMNTARFLAELDMIEKQHGGPVDRVVFYRHLARVCLRMNHQWPAFGFSFGRRPTIRVRKLDPRVCVRRRRGVPVVYGSVPATTRLAAALLVQTPTHPDTLWKEEAGVWLEQFVRRHAP